MSPTPQPPRGWEPIAAPAATWPPPLAELWTRAKGRYYVGRRPANAPEVYAVDADGVTRLRRRQWARIDWAAKPAGAHAFAAAVLGDLGGCPAPEAIVETFSREVVPELPAEGFVLDARLLASWLARAARTEQAHRARRPWAWLRRLL